MNTGQEFASEESGNFQIFQISDLRSHHPVTNSTLLVIPREGIFQLRSFKPMIRDRHYVKGIIVKEIGLPTSMDRDRPRDSSICNHHAVRPDVGYTSR